MWTGRVGMGSNRNGGAGDFVRELRRRRVFRVAALYLATAFGVLEAADILQGAMQLPAAFLPSVTILVILGFPANDFLGQEPGTNEEIKAFCTSRYNVSFPMFAKISVKGKDIHPLYQSLTEKATNPKFGGKISWNFNKFLLGRDGAVINRFGTRVKPLDPEITAAVEAALAERVTGEQ